jgi:hypothetical protein
LSARELRRRQAAIEIDTDFDAGGYAKGEDGSSEHYLDLGTFLGCGTGDGSGKGSYDLAASDFVGPSDDSDLRSDQA